jgi:acyl CoA:acetate/3-ketoacid CoA transferase alpha subunit
MDRFLLSIAKVEKKCFRITRRERSENLLEESLTGDYAFVKCYKADKEGNLSFHRTARNFNPDVATAGKIVIAEVTNNFEFILFTLG